MNVFLDGMNKVQFEVNLTKNELKETAYSLSNKDELD